MNKKEYQKITERFLDGLEAKALQSDTYFTERNKLYIENQELKEENARLNIELEDRAYKELKVAYFQLKDRIDKAVKYIETTNFWGIYKDTPMKEVLYGEELLDLLKGDKE